MNLTENKTRDVLETLKKLPPLCYTRLNTTQEVICIKRGVAGYFPAPSQKFTPEDLNLTHVPGVTPVQIEAMEAGSMFGWDCLGADVDWLIEKGIFTADGQPARRVA